ncbi:2269_t:CDS:2, partial [Racocetra fulgida]
ITIDIANDEVILSKDDFIKLINRTNQLEIFQAENQNLNKDLNISTSKERSIENVQIVDIEEYRLKSITDYIKALSMITQIPSLYKYLEHNILPV